MNGRQQMTGQDAADEAARWLVRLQAPEASANDWLAFERWLAASPEHAQAYDRLEALWAEMDDHAPELRRALDATPAPSPARRRARAQSAPRYRRWIAAAAAAAAVVVAGVTLFRVNMSALAPSLGAVAVYEAPAGQLRQVQLGDGTRIRLNAGSRMTVRLDSDARRVTMADGEAAFDVAHDRARPFLIHAGDQDVRVVGTEFNLRRRAGRVVLTVRRGVVEVRPADPGRADPVRLARGDQLTHEESSGRTRVVTVDPQDAFDWTEDRLIYRDTPLSEVAEDLGRRFAIPLRTTDARTGATRFSGVLVLDGKDEVLKRLAALAPVEVVRGPGEERMLRRRD